MNASGCLVWFLVLSQLFGTEGQEADVYPIARYLKQIKGLKGKNVGKFASLCGPPLRIFELELLFKPMAMKLEEVGAKLVSTLVLSSNFHELFVHVVFRTISR